MVLVTGKSYHLKDSFFNLVNDNMLMSNKENGGYRPHFCAIQDSSNSDIFWMIPISSKYSKYKQIHDRAVNHRGKCDKIVLGRFAGKDCAFLIQNAFCIKDIYVDHVHTVAGNAVTIHSGTVSEIESKLRTCLALKARGINLFYTDIDNIKSKI
ncbi:type III toxin-antitoxin system CptIN family toxin [Streptococcus suis]|uniref:type III toxin-antitoxin system CptIN family toxin n=1 Tax=Streptococcus suis TaxID=1307 RepID=UPI0015C56029|nr:hypothetical protein [Streptococcus suis]HEL1825115.1 hypothetical protein [Streptococcus suis]